MSATDESNPAELSERGAEFFLKAATNAISTPTTVYLGVYDEQTDSVGDTTDIGDLTTEPTDGSYARLEYGFDLGGDSAGDVSVTQNADGDWEIAFATKSIDLTNTTTSNGTSAYVDSFFIVATYPGAGNSSATEHMILSGRVSQADGTERRYHLPSVDELQIGGRFTLD